MYSPVEVVVAVVAAGSKWTALLAYTLHWPNAHNNSWHFLVHLALLWSTLLKTWNLSVSVCLCFCLSVSLSLSLSIYLSHSVSVLTPTSSKTASALSFLQRAGGSMYVAGIKCCGWLPVPQIKCEWLPVPQIKCCEWLLVPQIKCCEWLLVPQKKRLWMVAGSPDKMLWMVAGPPDKMLWTVAGPPDKMLWMVAGSPECACWASGCWPLTVSRWMAPSCAPRTPQGPSTSTTVSLSTPPRGSTSVTSILRVTRRSSSRLSLVLAAASSSVSLCVLFCRLSEQTGDACQGLSDMRSLECWSWVVLCFSDWRLARLLGLHVSFLLFLA